MPGCTGEAVARGTTRELLLREERTSPFLLLVARAMAIPLLPLLLVLRPLQLARQAGTATLRLPTLVDAAAAARFCIASILIVFWCECATCVQKVCVLCCADTSAVPVPTEIQWYWSQR